MGKEKFLVGELVGFIILLVGTLIYNEIIEIPIKFLNQNTKENIAKREEAEASNKAITKTLTNKNKYSDDTESLLVNATEHTKQE